MTITLTWMVLLLGWGIVNPAYQAPDEAAQYDLVLDVMGTTRYPSEGGVFLSSDVIGSRTASDWAKQATDRRAGAAPARGTRPTMEELGPRRDVDQVNQLTQHPPGFYTLSAAWLTAWSVVNPVPLAVSHDLQLWIARLLDVLLVAPLPLLAHRTARVLGLGRRRGRLASALVLTVPQLAYIGSSVNNDNLVALGLGIATWLAACIVTGEDRLATSVAAGLAIGIASYAKVMGLLGFAMLGAAHLYRVVVADDRWRAVRAGLATAAVGLVAGAWWFVRNVVVIGALQPITVPLPPPPAGFEPDLGVWAATYFGNLAQSFWGNFGYLDAPLPGPLVWLLTIGITAISMVAVWRNRRSCWALVAVCVAPVVVLVLGNAWQHWTAIYQPHGIFNASQGRYLFGGIVAGTVLASAAVSDGARRLAPLVALGLAVVLHLVGLVVMGQAFWGLERGLSSAVAAILAWAPLAAPVVVALGLGIVVGFAMLAWQVWSDRDPDPVRDPDPERAVS